MYTYISILFSRMETLTLLSLPGGWHHYCGRCKLQNKRHVLWPFSKCYFSQLLYTEIRCMEHTSNNNSDPLVCICCSSSPWHKSHMAAQTWPGGLESATSGTQPNWALTRCCRKSPSKRSKTSWDAQVTEAHNISSPPPPQAEQNATASCVISLGGEPAEASRRESEPEGRVVSLPSSPAQHAALFTHRVLSLVGSEARTPGEAPLFWDGGLYPSEPHNVRVPLLDGVGVRVSPCYWIKWLQYFMFSFVSLFPPSTQSHFHDHAAEILVGWKTASRDRRCARLLKYAASGRVGSIIHRTHHLSWGSAFPLPLWRFSRVIWSRLQMEIKMDVMPKWRRGSQLCSHRMFAV